LPIANEKSPFANVKPPNGKDADPLDTGLCPKENEKNDNALFESIL
jgi:hypothetical protein